MAALWNLSCASCGVITVDVACSIYAIPRCPTCGGEQGLTDPAEYHPFIPYFDVALGAQVDSLAQRKRLMRAEYDGDQLVRGQLDYREKMSKGDLSARNDRIHQQLQERARR